MTNMEIIMRASMDLMKQGIIKPSGRILTQELPDGTKIEVHEPEAIHTYNGWKDRGYQVKRGEHAKATFTIWKYTGKKDEETGDVEKGHCFPKKSFWFTFDQVEAI